MAFVLNLPSIDVRVVLSQLQTGQERPYWPTTCRPYLLSICHASNLKSRNQPVHKTGGFGIKC